MHIQYDSMRKDANDRCENCIILFYIASPCLALHHNWCQAMMFNGCADTNEQTIKITIRSDKQARDWIKRMEGKTINFWQKTRVHYDLSAFTVRRVGGASASSIFKRRELIFLCNCQFIVAWMFGIDSSHFNLKLKYSNARPLHFVGSKWILLEAVGSI